MEASRQLRREARPQSATSDPLERGIEALLRCGTEGHYEGEMRWCAMLTAQYVIAHALTGRSVPSARRQSLLRYFERGQNDQGLYGLHDHDFVVHTHSMFATVFAQARRAIWRRALSLRRARCAGNLR